MTEDPKEAIRTAAREDEIKAALKEALREWLDEQFAAFGRWSMMALAALALGAIVVFILWSQGWHKP